MNIRKSKLFNCIAVATLAFGFAFTAVAAEPAAVAKPMPGQITRKDGTKISGNIRWMGSGTFLPYENLFRLRASRGC